MLKHSVFLERIGLNAVHKKKQRESKREKEVAERVLEITKEPSYRRMEEGLSQTPLPGSFDQQCFLHSRCFTLIVNRLANGLRYHDAKQWDWWMEMEMEWCFDSIRNVQSNNSLEVHTMPRSSCTIGCLLNAIAATNNGEKYRILSCMSRDVFTREFCYDSQQLEEDGSKRISCVFGLSISVAYRTIISSM